MLLYRCKPEHRPCHRLHCTYWSTSYCSKSIYHIYSKFPKIKWSSTFNAALLLFNAEGVLSWSLSADKPIPHLANINLPWKVFMTMYKDNLVDRRWVLILRRLVNYFSHVHEDTGMINAILISLASPGSCPCKSTTASWNVDRWALHCFAISTNTMVYAVNQH